MDDIKLVLLVEDDPQDAIIVRRFLGRARRRRFTVSHVTRLEAIPGALQVTLPDVMLLDLTLPDARGLDSIRTALTLAPDTPIIVLTGVEDESLGMRAMEAGAQDYLVKGDCDARSLERAILYAIERKRVVRTTEHAALYDPLTGLPNRILLRDRLETAIHRARRSEEPLTLVALDLDDFRAVNDGFGNIAADMLLAQVAQRLRDVTQPGDTLARTGGDDFICVFEQHPGTRTQETLAAMHEALARPYKLHTTAYPDGHTVQITCSAGVACFPRDADTVDALLSAALHALRRAKGTGPGTRLHFGAIELPRAAVAP